MAALVLIVDDDDGIRLTLRDILEDEGYDVFEARDGVEGYAAVERHNPQIMLLDLNMPRMSGWELFERLQEAQLGVPTVIMTAGRRAADEASRLHAAASLAKPFDVDDVLTTVERLLPR
jgi:two-component system nitrogen regulation response regulator NtrX